MKKGTKVTIANYYQDIELRGKKGTVLGTCVDKCSTPFEYFKNEWACVRLENNKDIYLLTQFLIEEK